MSSNSQIVFACVGDKTGIIVSVSRNPAVDQSAKELLSITNFSEEGFSAFQSHPRTLNHSVQRIVAEDVAFVSISQEGVPQRTAFALLNLIKDEYLTSRSRWNSSRFQQYIKEQLDLFNSNPGADKLHQVVEKIDQVKVIMHENFEKVFARAVKIEEIEVQAHGLSERTIQFERKTTQVKCQLCLQNLKLTIALIVLGICVVVSLIAGLIVLILILKGTL